MLLVLLLDHGSLCQAEHGCKALIFTADNWMGEVVKFENGRYDGEQLRAKNFLLTAVLSLVVEGVPGCTVTLYAAPRFQGKRVSFDVGQFTMSDMLRFGSNDGTGKPLIVLSIVVQINSMCGESFYLVNRGSIQCLDADDDVTMKPCTNGISQKLRMDGEKLLLSNELCLSIDYNNGINKVNQLPCQSSLLEGQVWVINGDEVSNINVGKGKLCLTHTLSNMHATECTTDINQQWDRVSEMILDLTCDGMVDPGHDPVNWRSAVVGNPEKDHSMRSNGALKLGVHAEAVMSYLGSGCCRPMNNPKEEIQLDRDDCISHCRSDPGCLAVEVHEGTCSLFHDMATGIINDVSKCDNAFQRRCWIKGNINCYTTPNVTIEEGTIHSSTDGSIANPENCRIFCKNFKDSNIVGFTWEQNNKYCSCKQGITEVISMGKVSGNIYCAGPNFTSPTKGALFTEYIDRFCRYRDYEYLPVGTRNDCETKCANEEKCISYEWIHNELQNCRLSDDCIPKYMEVSSPLFNRDTYTKNQPLESAFFDVNMPNTMIFTGFSVVMWVKAYTADGDFWGLIFNPPHTTITRLGLKNGEVVLTWQDGDVRSGYILAPEVWVQLAVVWNERGNIFFSVTPVDDDISINNAQWIQDFGIQNQYNWTNLTHMRIGYADDQVVNNSFDLANFRVYSRALTPTDITQEFECQSASQVGSWYAYNDFIAKKKMSWDKVSYYSYQDQTGPLKNVITGDQLSVNIKTNYYTKNNTFAQDPNQGGQCAVGTDCSDAFLGMVDLSGTVELRSTDDWVMMEFFNLDMGATYTITATANAQAENSSVARVTLVGAQEYVEDSPLKIQTSQSTASFNTGDNTDNGYVVQWKEIDPGEDRAFGLRSEWDDLRGGKFGYAVTAIRLRKDPDTPDTPDTPEDETGKDDNAIEKAVGGIIITLLVVICIGVCAILYCSHKRQTRKKKETICSATTNVSDYDTYNKVPSPQSQSKVQNIRLTTRMNTFKFEDLMQPSLCGEGVFKKVYRCNLHGTPVAVSVLKVEPAAHLSDVQKDEQWNEMANEFSKEVRMNSSLSHQNIVQFMGVVRTISDTNVPMHWQGAVGLAFVTEYYPRGSLYDCLYKERAEFSLEDYMKIAIGICRGIAFLHYRKIVHLDLKPMNVLLTIDNNPKICDFGLAELRKMDAKGKIESGLPLAMKGAGTLRYWAPEQFPEEMSHKEIGVTKMNEKCDIWALGCVLTELFTRSVVWGANDVMHLMTNVAQGTGVSGTHIPPEVADVPYPPVQVVIRSCFKHKKTERPSASEVVDELTKFVENAQKHQQSHKSHKLQQSKTDHSAITYGLDSQAPTSRPSPSSPPSSRPSPPKRKNRLPPSQKPQLR